MRIGKIFSFFCSGSPESSEKTLYLQKLKEWEKEGVAEEERDEAVSNIKTFIKDPEKTELSFQGYFLTTVPPLGFIAERIKSLNLSHNQLQKLPESLGELHNLEELYLNNNQLQELPEWFGIELHNLKSLWVSYNPDLKEIPASLLDSPNFIELHSEGTQITKTLEELREERQEDRAVIAFNLLLVSQKINPRLLESSVSKVNHFIKERSLYLEELEDWEKEGVPGEERDVVISKIKAFIENPKETELSFFECRLKTLPPLAFIADRITSLDLSHNQLQKLPESLGELPNLKVLFLGYNQLQELPNSFVQLRRLESLLLGDNQFSKLPEVLGELHNLEYLTVSNNPDLKEIPRSLFNSSNFKGLYSEGTQITRFY